MFFRFPWLTQIFLNKFIFQLLSTSFFLSVRMQKGDTSLKFNEGTPSAELACLNSCTLKHQEGFKMFPTRTPIIFTDKIFTGKNCKIVTFNNFINFQQQKNLLF
jgi:hypothetical protein